MVYLRSMDKELEKRWTVLPKVDIKSDESMLMVNSQFVSLPDITPEILSDYIEIGQRTIDAHLLEMRKRSRYWGESKTRPSILVGRLALSGHEDGVFTDEGLLVESETDLTMDVVKKEYKGYWNAIVESFYVPEVSRNISPNNPAHGGTWLGLRRS